MVLYTLFKEFPITVKILISSDSAIGKTQTVTIIMTLIQAANILSYIMAIKPVKLKGLLSGDTKSHTWLKHTLKHSDGKAKFKRRSLFAK